MKKIINRVEKTKVYQIIQKAINMDKKYSLSIVASSISFYMISSIILIVIIGVQILNYTSSELNDFLFAKILNIFKEEVITKLEDIFPVFNFNKLSLLILLNIIWSSSAILNAYNRVSDSIYEEIPRRVAYRNRISAFFMFFMVIFIIIFELLFLIFSKSIVNQIFSNNYFFLQKLFLFIIENVVIFIVIIILNIYAPPRRVKANEAIIGSLFTTIAIYVILQVFILLVRVYGKISSGYKFLSIITFSFSFLFVINYVIILGLKINYEIWKNLQE